VGQRQENELSVRIHKQKARIATAESKSFVNSCQSSAYWNDYWSVGAIFAKGFQVQHSDSTCFDQVTPSL
jgi:hypothetical protein